MMYEFDSNAGEGAGIILDKITGQKYVIVLHVAGVTEILKIGTSKWTEGPIFIPDGYMPMTAILTFPLTVAMEGEFFVFGGAILDFISQDLIPNDIVYKMVCENDECLWSKTSVQLSEPMSSAFPVAISVPNEVLNCK